MYVYWSCKAMYKASKERAVGRHMGLEREEAMKWLDNDHYLAVVTHLAGAGSLEARFIIGLTLVFARQDMQRDLLFLERGAVAGHKAAAYVLGLLLYTAGETCNIGNHYISQVEGEPADGGCEMAKRTS